MRLCDLFQSLLEVFQPLDKEMAVLEHEPVPALCGSLQGLKCNLLLSLAHGKQLQPIATEAKFLCQLLQVSCRVSPWTEDDDDWRVGGGLVEDVVQTDDRGSDILLFHAVHHKPCDGIVHTVHAEAAQDHELLKGTKALPVLAREGSSFRSIEVVPLQPQTREREGEGEGEAGREVEGGEGGV